MNKLLSQDRSGAGVNIRAERLDGNLHAPKAPKIASHHLLSNLFLSIYS